MQDSIAIIGIGCRLPGGIDTPEQFWEMLCNEKNAISEVPSERWDLNSHFNPDPRNPLTQHVRRGGFVEDIDLFDPGFFGITPREAICMDPQQRLLLEVAWRSIEDSRQPLEKLRGNAVGVFIGISSADYSSLLWASNENYVTPDNEPFILPGNTGCIAANRLSYFLDLKGPSFTVDTACSSSLVAVHLACKSLWQGESDLAIAGGVQALIHPGIQMSFCKAGLLSPEGRCKSFDAEANGYVRSEGAGVVLLKPLAKALKDGDPIHALIRGTAVNSDGRSQGLAAPSQRTQSACVQAAYNRAGINPSETQYVEAHGTGTRQGDPIELRALGSVLSQGRKKNKPCRVGSVKTNLGHGETAAGITGLIKTVLCLKERQIPANLHFQKPNPLIDFEKLGLKVQTTLESFPEPNKELIAGVSSFGFGGTNAHAILSDCPKSLQEDSSDSKEKLEPPIYLLCLSAKSSSALEILSEKYSIFISNHKDISLNDIICSTHFGRTLFPHRIIVIGRSREEIISQLQRKTEPAWIGEAESGISIENSLGGALDKNRLGENRKDEIKYLKELAADIGKAKSINWKNLHKEFPYKPVKLPGHPFIKQRYWWNELKSEHSKSSLWLEHIGKSPNESTKNLANTKLSLNSIDLPGPIEHFKTTFKLENIPDLNDHVIREWIVFPAAGYLALALDLKKERGEKTNLSNLRIDYPLKANNQEFDFQALLQQGVMNFYSQSNSEGWQRHGQLDFELSEPIKQHKHNEEKEISDSEVISIEPAKFYKNLSSIGFLYGELYQPIQILKAKKNISWATLKRPKDAPDRCLIDGCFQSVAACIAPNRANGQLFLPVEIGHIELKEWPLPDEFECKATLQPSDDKNLTLLADIEITKNGNYLGIINGLRLRRITRSVLDLLFPPKATHLEATGLYQTEWSPLRNNLNSAAYIEPEKIFLAGNSNSEFSNSLKSWAEAKDITINLINSTKDIEEPNSPLIIWPDRNEKDPKLVTKKFLKEIKYLEENTNRPILLVLEGISPATSALKSFQRSLSIERPNWELTTLHFSSGSAKQPTHKDWGEIWARTKEQSELLWDNGILKGPKLTKLEEERFQIRSDGTGRIEGLYRRPLHASNLLAGEVEIAVEATGLNFRDVLNALGLLKDHATSLGLDNLSSLPFGGEAVGIVVAAGPEVSKELIGKRVIAALTIGSLASHVVTREELCISLPKEMSAEDGASFSTAFLTAKYGLEKLANLKKNEKILIHAAAGGVGQAAVQIAKKAGARVFATASEAKHALLLEQGVEKVFDSRSLSFKDQLLASTNNEGVDVVLNSLKGAWVEASFSTLKTGGRFIELGKIDIWSKEKATKRRPDAQYLPFDLLEIAVAEPKTISNLLHELTVEFSKGIIKNIPQKVWQIDKFKEAFKFMAQARHVGKVIISQPKKIEPLSIKANATYLISGALGGIGLQVIKWLFEEGAKSLILLSRSTQSHSPEALKLLNFLESEGVRYKIVECNFSLTEKSIAEEEINKAIKVLPKSMPLKGILHAAGVKHDSLISSIDEDSVEKNMSAKVSGWQLLDKIANKCSKLDFLIGFSSIAALLGSPGQAAYAAGNGAMEGYCEASEHSPHIRLSIQWGPWAGKGMAEGLDRRFESVGIGMLDPKDALKALSKLLKRGEGGVVAAVDNDWTKLASQSSPRQRDWFVELIQTTGPSASEKLWQKLKELPDNQHQEALMNELRVRLAKVMAAESEDEYFDPESIDSSESLFNLGLDSLMAVEYAAVIQTELGLRLDLDALSDDPSLDALAALGLKQLTPQVGEQNDEGLNLGEEAKLDKNLTSISIPPNPAPGEKILLTGASGFLGAYLLAGQLKRWPDLQIKCLVRAKSKQIGLERIKSNLALYELWDASWETRLEPILGDLSLQSFGLAEENFFNLSKDIGGILHNGAQLSQMASYAQLSAANVGGTKEILRLATAKHPIRIEHISSVSVFEAEAYRNSEILESDDLKDWQGIHIGYSQTKWVSERLILQAGRLGLPTAIYRPPLIGGHSVTGHWHEGDLLQRLLQGCLALGKAPQLAWELDLVPVDYVADAVSALAWKDTTNGHCFHLQHPRPLMLNDLLAKLISDGAPLKQIPMKDWLEAIASDPTNPLYPLRAFFQQRWGPEQLTYPELNALGIRARPSCTITQAALKDLNVQCPDFNELMGTWASSLFRSSVAA